MCLLITGKSNEIRATLLNTRGLLNDIFRSNEDGVGAMYVTSKHVLRTPKVLPKNLAECTAFIKQLPNDDRNLALHFRMRTHGATDLLNCHPYDVIPGKIALMHNGVLMQGNAADKTKSDTWHYIKNIVRPLLEDMPKAFRHPTVQELLAGDITASNRFAIMDSDGELVVLNKHTGITHEGLWFSNTYAWDPALLIPGYRKALTTARGGWFRGDDDDDDGWSGTLWTGHGSKSQSAGRNEGLALDEDAEEDDLVSFKLSKLSEIGDLAWDALSTGDASTLAYILDKYPFSAFDMILGEAKFTPDPDDTPTAKDQAVINLLVEGNRQQLVRLCYSSSDHVADVMCECGTWSESSPVVDTPPASTAPAPVNTQKRAMEMTEEEWRTAIAEYETATAATH